MKGGGYGILGNIIIGIIGAVIGGWVFGLLGLGAGGGLIGSIIVAFIGAVILIFLARLIKRA
ncbi:GlsB/YeaQ/YmgE family stress response membrane protein [Diaphorobacter aerolatus]|uniref:GlsB/YeaQ/YmgE family stress response membrane protein n=1 Tax=Diaphorobacter aerolatus TaxID=1288495 RepID=A0A7H0GG40_9BURK|nr:GlsB/YeaQ/YmgE family stress response membrane protein [Diaphorobacter aerolatus]QNP47256.1 GlsB/YeaQ/YmgE family stress response membrane protein [Diaphorobacter aerolatus]